MSGMDYKTFQDNFKILTKNNATQDQIFDMLITPFVSALHYHTTLSLNKHTPGDMIISHSSDAQRITVYPDNNSTIIFKDANAQQEIEYSDHTLIVEFDIDKTQIKLIIPYFGKYVVDYIANFYDNEVEYKTILGLTDYNIRKSLDTQRQKKFFYQLAVIYDLNQQNKTSQMLINMINKLIKNKDNALINLLVKDISQASSLPSDQIRNKILSELTHQTKEEHYLFTHTSLLPDNNNNAINTLLKKNKTTNFNNKVDKEKAEEEIDDDPLSSFINLSNDNDTDGKDNSSNKDNKKQGEENNVSSLFKQR